MKNFFSILMIMSIAASLRAAPGDTTIVQTISYSDAKKTDGSCRRGKYLFPDGTKRYERILMYYSLKCDPSQNPACGEWDYVYDTELLQPTGKYDTIALQRIVIKGTAGSSKSALIRVNNRDTVQAFWDLVKENFRFQEYHLAARDTIVSSTDTLIYNKQYYTWVLGCYVTPYGIGLSMGTGWTWVYDVSDFVHLLKDSVIIQDCNQQELLDLKFAFIEGVPSRDVINIKPIWMGNPSIWGGGYMLSNFDTFVRDTTILLTAAEKQVKLRSIVTGHGFSETSLCGEFCPNMHSIKANGNVIRRWQILQNCANNPLSPQGGTWIYDRAGWCPGMPATTYETELTNYIQGNAINFDYDITANPEGAYRARIYLVSYGEMNHAHDAVAETIIAPNSNPIYKRSNPTCGSPIVVIKNMGEQPLTNLEIKYRIDNGQYYTYAWKGNLPFGKLDTVTLPTPIWGEPGTQSRTFHLELLNPNGQTDATPHNNVLTSSFVMPQMYTVNQLRFDFKTDSHPAETTWKLYSSWGVLYENQTNMTANTSYSTEMVLENGCYRMYLHDKGKDGLSFFSQSVGSAQLLRKNGSSYTNMYKFEPNFGEEAQYYFALNTYTGLKDPLAVEQILRIYPNPAQTELFIDLLNITGKQLSAIVFDMLGRPVSTNSVTAGEINSIQVDHLKQGIYMIVVQENQKTIARNKLVIQP